MGEGESGRRRGVGFWTHCIWVKESNRGRQLRRELESGDIGHYEKWWSRTKRWDGMLGVCKYGADSLNRNEIALRSYKVTFSHLVSLSLATI